MKEKLLKKQKVTKIKEKYEHSMFDYKTRGTELNNWTEDLQNKKLNKLDQRRDEER